MSTDSPKSDPSLEPPPTPPKPGVVNRRALLRAGAGVAPVLLTLRSGPVSANGMISCTVASSFVSVTTFKSRNPTATTMQCTSKSARDWRDDCTSSCRDSNSNKWPAHFQPRIKNLFVSTGSTHDNSRVADVLRIGSSLATSGELCVLQNLLGLSLSVEKGIALQGSVTKPYLSSVWANYHANGKRYRLRAANINWGEAELISWLRMLQYPLAIPA